MGSELTMQGLAFDKPSDPPTARDLFLFYLRTSPADGRDRKTADAMLRTFRDLTGLERACPAFQRQLADHIERLEADFNARGLT